MLHAMVEMPNREDHDKNSHGQSGYTHTPTPAGIRVSRMGPDKIDGWLMIGITVLGAREMLRWFQVLFHSGSSCANPNPLKAGA
jgi:hypothetical protein